ncbi:WbqC family protein [Neolewinella aurantiaca]|uniref:WbqC family protein n=1 Tax=Neolewinella aurantiaca TaxID=2602767 RepID=A0A5C7FDT8_9BACT|nr:WbqC family protein [Neolewinella aurantiaca]TXF88395.1 WbqC family protein [Neolewinella aurantiaca]
MKKPTPLLTTTAYFPPAHWLTGARDAGAWLVEGHENYQKGGQRNRCLIAGPNGTQTLSVPLEKGKHNRKPVREVRISYRNDWWREHEQSIRTAYGRSPFYEYYAEEIFAVPRSHPETLWELNQQITSTIVRLLQWPVLPETTEDFIFPDTPGYQRPGELPAGLSPYPQVFTDRHGYLARLSVLDALFCLGPGLTTKV